MPLYEYQCNKCDKEFSELQTLQEYSPIRVCPSCFTPSSRKISAPQLRLLTKNDRMIRDRQEKSIYEPLRVTKKHVCNHDHEHSQKGVFKQIQAGSRPWMLG